MRFLFFTFLALVGCNNNGTNDVKVVDSFASNQADSITITTNETSPNVDLSKPLVENGQVIVSARNGTGKTIDGIRIDFVLINNFDEVISNFTAQSQTSVKPGAAYSYTFDIPTKEKFKTILSNLQQVHYSDGTNWQSSE